MEPLVLELLRCMTTEQLTEAVESVDPDWSEHFAGDLDRAVSCYGEYDADFARECERIVEEETA